MTRSHSIGGACCLNQGTHVATREILPFWKDCGLKVWRLRGRMFNLAFKRLVKARRLMHLEGVFSGHLGRSS